MRINRLQADGYSVIPPGGLEGLKDNAPALYDKAFQEGYQEGLKKGREAEKADNHTRIMASIKRAKAKDNVPKTPQEQWDSDPALRAEFSDNFGAYKAFEENHKAGKTKIFNAVNRCNEG